MSLHSVLDNNDPKKKHRFVLTFVEMFSKIKNKLERETELIFFASVETGASVETEPTTKKTKTQPGSVEQVVAMPLYEFAEFGPCQILFCCVCVAFLSLRFHLSSVF